MLFDSPFGAAGMSQVLKQAERIIQKIEEFCPPSIFDRGKYLTTKNTKVTESLRKI